MDIGLSRLKMIDHLVGLPLCVILSLWCGLVRALRGAPMPVEEPKRALVIKFFGLGSIGYSTVVARDLKRKYPRLHVTLLTFEENRSFAEFLGSYDAVLGIEKRRPLRFLADTIAILIKHLRRPYDLCVDLEYYSKYTTLHTVFTRAPVRVGFYLPNLWRRYVYTHHSFFNTAKHVRRLYGMAAESAGAGPSEESPALFQISADSMAAVDGILRGLGWDGGRGIVGVNINASDLALGRRWPPERFARLVGRLAKEGYAVYLTGTLGERDYVESCRTMIQPGDRERVVNLAGKLSIFEFIAFLGMVRLFVTTDSGPMIFAVLAGSPSVSLWGPGDPKMFGGQAPLHTFVYSAFPCSPCMYIPNTDAGKFCDHLFPCMSAIDEDTVFRELMARLGEL